MRSKLIFMQLAFCISDKGFQEWPLKYLFVVGIVVSFNNLFQTYKRFNYFNNSNSFIFYGFVCCYMWNVTSVLLQVFPKVPILYSRP